MLCSNTCFTELCSGVTLCYIVNIYRYCLLRILNPFTEFRWYFVFPDEECIMQNFDINLRWQDCGNISQAACLNTVSLWCGTVWLNVSNG